MHGKRAAEADGGTRSRNPTACDRSGVACSDFDSHGVTSRARVHVRGHGSERFGEHEVRASVQDAVRLRVAFYWHPGHRTLWADLEHFDAHLCA